MPRTTIEVVAKYDGKPHMLFMLTEDVEKGDELLIDYQDDFWDAYRNNTEWMSIVRGARENEQDKSKEKLAVVEAEKQAAQVLLAPCSLLLLNSQPGLNVLS